MYKHFYNLKRNPFDKTIPTTEAFSTKDLTALTSRIDHLVALGGIGLVCAGPGFGKTFAMRAWANRQNKNTLNFFYVCLSTVTAMEFYRILCTELGLEPSSKKADMFRVIQQHLRYMTVEKGIRTVVVIDEAQYLRAEIRILAPSLGRCRSRHIR